MNARAGNEVAEGWRVFCAVELPSEVREKIAGRISRLRKAGSEVRASWAREDALHITLKFIGEVDGGKVDSLSNAAAQAVLGLAPFELAIACAGAFPPHGPPRVLWLGVEDEDGSLAKLQRNLEDACATVGFAREDRKFHPHLTLARIRAPGGARELARIHKELPFHSLAFRVDSLVVMRSELNPKGSRYSVISRHALAG
jgi:2'-5' RNA ligase